ncbi:MAG TPA: DUF4124 domain-containing protein, partial [Gammaproteobacteria bacterium]
ASPAVAEVYKCTAPNGKVVFQDSACEATAAQRVVNGPKKQGDEQGRSAGSKPIEELTLKDLAGVWQADYGGGLREEWIFTSGGALIHSSYKGRVIQSQYSFSKGVITVHHKPALVNPYDEDMTIIRWGGDEMQWRSMVGTTVTAHRK